MRRMIGVVLGVLVWLSTAVAGEAGSVASRSMVTQDQQKDLAVTIYNGNLGLVKDVREFQLAVGTHEVKFMDVASQIDPTSVHLKSLTDPAGVRIL